jgi:hypothetical protein
MNRAFAAVTFRTVAQPDLSYGRSLLRPIR